MKSEIFKVILAMLIIGMLVIPIINTTPIVYASVANVYSPSANADGTVPWTNPANAYADDTNYATAATYPTFRSAASESSGTGAVTVALPGTKSANDVIFMIAVCYTGGTLAITASGSISTWNAMSGSPVDVASGEKLYVWWGVYSSGTTGATITPTSGDHIEATMIGYYNVNTSSPIDVSATGSRSSSTNFTFVTGLTNNYNGELSIVICTSTQDSNTGQFPNAFTNANLSSINTRFNDSYNGGNGGGFGIAEGLLGTAGAVGTWATTISNATPQSYMTFSLKPTVAANVYDQIYGTYSATDVVGNITKLEVGYLAAATATGQLDIYVSNNTGTTWSSAHNTGNLATTIGAASLTYIDCTSDFVWSPTGVNNTNLKVKVITHYSSGAPVYTLDYLPIRITFQQIPDAPTSFTSPSQTTSSIYLTWTKGTNSDKTIIRLGTSGYPTSITDGYSAYDLGTATNVNITAGLPTDTSILQEISNGNVAVSGYASHYQRAGERLNSFPASTITSIAFKIMIQLGSPTGTGYVRVRQVSDDSILGTIGTIDVATISSVTPTWYTFNGTVSNPTQQDIRILFEYSGGGSGDYLYLRTSSYDPYAYGDDTVYHTSYSDASGFDAAFRIYYTYNAPLTPCTTYYFRAWAYNSSSADYSSATADLTQSTSCGGTPSLTNSPSSKAFGVINPSSTYYAKGSSPNNPVQNGDCTFNITNDGSISIDLAIKCTNFTGGVGWNLTSSAPGADQVRMTAYYSGQNPASGVVLTTSNQNFYTTGLAASGTLMWDFKLETGTFGDGVAKSATLELTATAH